MSVKRFDCIGQGDCSVEEFYDGPYVKYEDYQKLYAELEASNRRGLSFSSEIKTIRKLCENTIKKCTSRYSEWEGSRRSFAKQIIEILDGKKDLL